MKALYQTWFSSHHKSWLPCRIFVNLGCPAGEPWLWAPPVSAIRVILIMMMRRSPDGQSLTAGHAVTVPEGDWPSQESDPSLRRLRRRSGVWVQVTVTMPVSLASRHRRTPAESGPLRPGPAVTRYLIIDLFQAKFKQETWLIYLRKISWRVDGIRSNFKFHWNHQHVRAWGLYNFAFSFEIDVVRLHHDHQSIFLIQVGLASKTINLMDIYQHYRRINWWGFEIWLKSTSFGGHEVCNYFHQLLDHF
jgi:hypothetical protein